MGEISLKIKVVCTKLPGLRFDALREEHAKAKEPVYLGIQRGKKVIHSVPGNRCQVTFGAEFTIGEQADGSPNFLGPYAHGNPADRFFYLALGIRYEFEAFHMFRRLKIRFKHLTWSQVNDSIQSQKPIIVRLKMTDEEGGPLCGEPRKNIRWEI